MLEEVAVGLPPPAAAAAVAVVVAAVTAVVVTKPWRADSQPWLLGTSSQMTAKQAMLTL